MILLEMVKSGVEPKTENYREILGLNDEKLYPFFPKINSSMNPAAKNFQGSVEYLESEDVSPYTPLHSKLNDIESDLFICEYLKAMCENNELGSLPTLLSALSCIMKKENAHTAFNLFENNIKDVIKKTNDSIIENEKNSNIKIDSNNKIISWSKKQEYTTFNVISIPDHAVQTLWMKLIGEISFICFRTKSTDLIEKYENIMKLYFHPDTIQLANFHRLLISYAFKNRSNSIDESKSNVTFASSVLDIGQRPILRDNFPKFPETKSEKAVLAVIRISRHFFWCGVPYTTHYNLALQACKNENRIEDIHHIIRAMRYNVKTNKIKCYSSPDSKSKDIQPKIIERLNSTTYEIFMNAMSPNKSNETIDKFENSEVKNNNTDKEEMFNNNQVKKSTKNENEIIFLALEFSNETLLNNSISDKLTKDISEDEIWARKFSNISIIRLLEKAFELCINDAMYSTVRSHENENERNVPNNNNSSPPIKVDINAQESLKNAVTIFNAISVCNFPHSVTNYQNLLRAYLRLVNALNEVDNNDSDDNIVGENQHGNNNNENGINNENVIETEYINEKSKKLAAERKHVLSYEERMRYLEDAVDLFEGMCSMNLSIDQSTGENLMSTIFNSRNTELLYRLITATPFSEIERTPISGNITAIFSCLSDLKKHQELLEFSVDYSMASNGKVQKEFSNIENWRKIITAVSELKKNEKTENFERLDGDDIEFSRRNEMKTHSNGSSIDFPIDEIRAKTASNIITGQNGRLTKTDQDFVTIIENCSKVRIFVENNQFVSDIVDNLVEKGLPYHALSFVKKAIEDCEFSSPKNIYESRSLAEIEKQKKVYLSYHQRIRLSASQRNQEYITDNKDEVLMEKLRVLRKSYAPQEMSFRNKWTEKLNKYNHR